MTLVMACSAIGWWCACAAATVPSFTGGPLPPPPGDPVNDVEPGVAASGNGTFIIGATSGTRGSDLWTSHDGGLTYRYSGDPFQSPPEGGLPVNGEDTDVAAAPVSDGSGPPNLYATSLYVANSALVVSHDGGETYKVNEIGGTPSQDRPWVAADGPCTVYLAYQNADSGPPSREMVSRFDACKAPRQTGSGAVIDPVQGPTDPYPLGAFLAGKIMVDTSSRSRFQHRVYLPMGGCETDLPGGLFLPSTDPFDCQFAREALSIAVSTDRGRTFTVHRVADSPSHEIQVWPDQLAVDAAGEIYLAWSDNHHVYLNTSTDGGSTWSRSRVISKVPARSAVLPTVAAGAPGHIDIAWYGAPRDSASNDQSVMGAPGARGAAPWRVYFAKSTSAGRSFDQVAVSPTIHTGIVCTSAEACTVPHSRDLFEDFGIAISPTTQCASLAYDIDQFTTRPQSSKSDHVIIGYATELPGGSGQTSGCRSSEGHGKAHRTASHGGRRLHATPRGGIDAGRGGTAVG